MTVPFDPTTRLWLALLAATFVLGCPNPGPGPCEDDAFGCEVSGGLELDPSCELDGELVVELGWGLDDFSAFDEEPARIWHGFQGGTHTFLGVRVPNAALDRYERIEVTFRHDVIEAECLDDWPDVILSRDFLEECATGYVNERRVLFGERAAIRTDADGGMVEWGIFLEIPWSEPTVVSAEVRDPCDRRGFDAVVFSGGG